MEVVEELLPPRKVPGLNSREVYSVPGNRRRVMWWDRKHCFIFHGGQVGPGPPLPTASPSGHKPHGVHQSGSTGRACRVG